MQAGLSATDMAEKPALSPMMDQRLSMKQSLPKGWIAATNGAARHSTLPNECCRCGQ